MKIAASILVSTVLLTGCFETVGLNGDKNPVFKPKPPRHQSGHVYKARESGKTQEDVVRGNDSYSERLDKYAQRSAEKARKAAIEAKVAAEQKAQAAELEQKTGLRENKIKLLYRWYTFLSVLIALFIVKKIYNSAQKV